MIEALEVWAGVAKFAIGTCGVVIIVYLVIGWIRSEP
jgi:hypothetical protein